MATDYVSTTKAANDDVTATNNNNIRADCIRRAGDYETAAGTGDAITLAIDSSIAAYAAGQVFRFQAAAANTTSATLNVNSLGAKTIKKYNDQNLVANDIESGMEVCVIYDGTNMQLQTPTATTPTPVSVQNSSYVYAADAEASDTYVITLSPAPTAYATGQVFHFKANTLNTAGATLNVNSLGAKTLVKKYNIALETGDILANQIVTVVYDGTNFQVLSKLARTVYRSNGVDGSRAFSAVSSTLTIAHGLGRAPNMVRVVAVLGNNATIIHAQSNGVYNGSTTACTMWADRDASSAIAETSTSNIVVLYGATTGAVSGASQTATVSVDATNISLVFTKGGSGHESSNIYIMWEAEVDA